MAEPSIGQLERRQRMAVIGLPTAGPQAVAESEEGRVSAITDRAVKLERKLCCEDICPYCRSQGTGWNPIPDGPNAHGTWRHTHKSGASASCCASRIYARAAMVKTRRSE